MILFLDACALIYRFEGASRFRLAAAALIARVSVRAISMHRSIGVGVRLQFVETRIAEVDKLRRKYGHTVEEILAFYDQVSADLQMVEGADERRDFLRKQVEKLREEYAVAAADLGARRRKAADKLDKRVEAELKDLNMERSRFVISCSATLTRRIAISV